MRCDSDLTALSEKLIRPYNLFKINAFKKNAMKKVFLLSITLTLAITSCHKHDEDTAYVVNITINKPTANQIVAKNTAMPIDVVITRADNAVIHNVKIEITDAAGTSLETLLEKHYHVSGTATYSDTYTPKNAGNFKLKVTSTTDVDGDPQPNTKEVAFSVN
jgi:hypothetical protein